MFQTFNSENGHFKDAGICSKCGKLDYIVQKGDESLCKTCLTNVLYTPKEMLWNKQYQRALNPIKDSHDEWYVPTKENDIFE